MLATDFEDLVKRQRKAERDAVKEQLDDALQAYRDEQSKLTPAFQSAGIDFVSHALKRLADKIQKAQVELIPDMEEGNCLETCPSDSSSWSITKREKIKPGPFIDSLPLLALKPETLALIALRTIFNCIMNCDDDKEDAEVPSESAVVEAISRSCYEQWKQWVLACPRKPEEQKRPKITKRGKTEGTAYPHVKEEPQQETKREAQQGLGRDAIQMEQEVLESGGARSLDELADLLLLRYSKGNRHAKSNVRDLIDKFKDQHWAKENSGRRLGCKILCMAQELGLIEITLEPHPQHTGWSINRVRLSSDLVKRAAWIANEAGASAIFRPQYGPMICPPDKRTGLRGGGFLTARDPARAENWALCDLVKHRNHPKHLQELKQASLDQVCMAVNALQETPWRLNRPIYNLLCEAWKNKILLPGFPDRDELPALETKADEWFAICRSWRSARQSMLRAFSIKESLKQWEDYQCEEEKYREKLTEYEYPLRRYHALLSRSERLDRLVDTCENLLKRYADLGDDLRLYFPYQLDYRGRIYSMVTALSPQGDDIERALLEFADGKALGEDGEKWLAVHLANTGGARIDNRSKLTFEERVKWVWEHNAEICALATLINPNEELTKRIVRLSKEAYALWENAKKPWSFLAACVEWANHENRDFVSRLPVALDASASGFQHLSALLRDENLARVTNLLPPAAPTDPPQDLYGTIAEDLKTRVNKKYASHGIRKPDSRNAKRTRLAQTWVELINRDTVKLGVMTLPYGAGRKTRAKQILNYVQELEAKKPGTFEDPKAAAMFLAGQLESVLDQDLLKGARQEMEWLQEVAKMLVKECYVGVSWTTPVGFPVVVEPYRSENLRVTTRYGGKRHSDSYKKDPSGDQEIHEGDLEKAIAANFIHSLDAAHLVLTICQLHEKGLRHFSVIHDSYAVHACDIPQLREVLRQTFVTMHCKSPLDDFLKQQREIMEAILEQEIEQQKKDLWKDSYMCASKRKEQLQNIYEREMHKIDLPEMKELERERPVLGNLKIELVRKSEYMFS